MDMLFGLLGSKPPYCGSWESPRTSPQALPSPINQIGAWVLCTEHHLVMRRRGQFFSGDEPADLLWLWWFIWYGIISWRRMRGEDSRWLRCTLLFGQESSSCQGTTCCAYFQYRWCAALVQNVLRWRESMHQPWLLGWRSWTRFCSKQIAFNKNWYITSVPILLAALPSFKGCGLSLSRPFLIHFF